MRLTAPSWPIAASGRSIVPNDPARTRFVLGFLFSEDGTRIAVINKNRPAWQAGAINGLGGKIEAGEKPLDAMNREFREEAGVFVGLWDRFAELYGTDFEVVVFRAFSDACLHRVSTVGDERVEVMPIRDALATRHISNLSWLLPLALDRGTKPTADLGPRLVVGLYDAALLDDDEFAANDAA